MWPLSYLYYVTNWSIVITSIIVKGYMTRDFGKVHLMELCLNFSIIVQCWWFSSIRHSLHLRTTVTQPAMELVYACHSLVLWGLQKCMLFQKVTCLLAVGLNCNYRCICLFVWRFIYSTLILLPIELNCLLFLNYSMCLLDEKWTGTLDKRPLYVWKMHMMSKWCGWLW